MLAVDDRHHAVKTEEGGDGIVHEEGLGDGARIGNAASLDDDVVELDLAPAATQAQISENLGQVAADRAADAAVVHVHNLFPVRLNKQIRVDVLLAEFIFDNGDLVVVVLAEDAIQQRRLAGTEKTRKNRHRNVRLLFFNHHFFILVNNEPTTGEPVVVHAISLRLKASPGDEVPSGIRLRGRSSEAGGQCRRRSGRRPRHPPWRQKRRPQRSSGRDRRPPRPSTRT